MRAAGRARRLLTRIRPPVIRRAAQALCLGVAGTATLLNAQEAWRVTEAEFDAPTTRYGHAVLGDDVEYSQLRIHVEQDGDAEQSEAGVRRDVFEVDLPVDHVFEDLAPRLWDITGDGLPEVVVVETDVAQGAQLAVYNSTGDKIAATPHIGQTNRWLAPVGAADLDGDGHIEVAYIDRPHLAKTLRIWRFHYGKLVEVAAAPGRPADEDDTASADTASAPAPDPASCTRSPALAGTAAARNTASNPDRKPLAGCNNRTLPASK